MDYVQQPYRPGETIAAVATPPGEGGVAIIRISGDDAVVVASKVFSRNVAKLSSHTVHYGQIRNPAGVRIDDVLLIPMLAPKSYTGEDTVEIHCHGGGLITRRVLDVVLKAGARGAMPGEFTFKAFMNGKLDLAQAEAVQELIAAKNERALDAAEEQLNGLLSKKIMQFQNELTHSAAILEAWVDFPEEGLEFATMEEIVGELKLILGKMQQLLKTFHNGKILHDGLSVCLVGRPNVGKSSLMNALLDKDRAIVSNIPGTTRDVIEDHIRINGLNIRLTDTAGIREANEQIEMEGIRRSKQALAQADLVLFVIDSHEGMNCEDVQLIDLLPQKKTIVIWNKSDLPQALPNPAFSPQHSVRISAKQRTGIEQLYQEIDKVIWKDGPPSKEELLLTNVRHKEALAAACNSCECLITGLQTGISPEFLAMDMRQTLQELGKIIGTNISEDILSAIFSTFCIGK